MDSTCTLPKKSQHAQYAQHFPIPAENVTAHESNQRLILLYGVGKARSQAIATTKEVMKALCAMLNDLGKVDDSGLCTDQGQSNEYLVLKRERDEKRAVLYRLVWDQYLCYNTRVRSWVIHAFWLVIIYDPVGNKRIDDITSNKLLTLNYLLYSPTDAAPQFFRNLPLH